MRNPDGDPEAAAELLHGEIDGQDIDGFRYFVDDHRGRAQVRYETPFGEFVLQGVCTTSTRDDESRRSGKAPQRRTRPGPTD